MTAERIVPFGAILDEANTLSFRAILNEAKRNHLFSVYSVKTLLMDSFNTPDLVDAFGHLEGVQQGIVVMVLISLPSPLPMRRRPPTHAITRRLHPPLHPPLTSPHLSPHPPSVVN